MQDIMHPGLKDYVGRKAAELDEVNAELRKAAERAGGQHRDMTHLIVQFVVDARTRQVDCTTRFIRPGMEHVDLADAQADLAKVVRRNAGG